MSDKKTRRRVLRQGIAGVAGLSVPSLVVKGYSNNQEAGLDTGFDPENQNEVKQFLSDLLDLSKSEQERVFQTLSEKQKEVVAEGLSLKEVKISSASGVEPSTEISPSGTNSHSATYIQSGQSTLGENIWDYHHEIQYEYSGSGCPIDITDVSHSTWATNVSLGWSYDGDVSDSTDIITGGCGGSDEGRALTQGKFSYALDGTAYTANPMSRLAGSTKYDFGISQYVADAWVVEQQCDYCNGIVGDG